MNTYATLKLIHVSLVSVSGLLFVYRFGRRVVSPDQPLSKLLRVLPHVNDTGLLASAVALLVLVGMNPLEIPWLLAKFMALLLYIALGALCMRAQPRSLQHSLSFVAAMAVFTYIVLVALSKQLLPLQSLG